MPDFTGWTICKRFKIIKLLGKGAHGMVYSAKDIMKDNMKIAVKVGHSFSILSFYNN